MGGSPAPALGAALLLLLGACAAPQPPPPAAPAPAALSTWNIGTSRYQHIKGDCDGPEGCTSVKLEYPLVLAAPGGRAAAAAIDRFIRVDLIAATFGEEGGTPDELADGLAGNLREILAENPEVPRRWWVRQKIEVLLQEPRVLSLKAWTESYMGGERTIEELRLASFDARTGARLRLEDLVDLKGDARERFAGLLEERLRADRDIPAERPLAEAGFELSDGHLPLPTEFALAPEGLILHWGLFVLGSEELGTVTMTMTREALTPGPSPASGRGV